MQTIQMHFSRKQNFFFLIFLGIFQIYINIWTFSNKHDPQSLCISEITDPERRGLVNV